MVRFLLALVAFLLLSACPRDKAPDQKPDEPKDTKAVVVQVTPEEKKTESVTPPVAKEGEKKDEETK